MEFRLLGLDSLDQKISSFKVFHKLVHPAVTEEVAISGLHLRFICKVPDVRGVREIRNGAKKLRAAFDPSDQFEVEFHMLQKFQGNDAIVAFLVQNIGLSEINHVKPIERASLFRHFNTFRTEVEAVILLQMFVVEEQGKLPGATAQINYLLRVCSQHTISYYCPNKVVARLSVMLTIIRNMLVG